VLFLGFLSDHIFVRRIGTKKRARVQERHWAHFVSAIRLSKSSPSRTMTPKPAAGLPTEVVNDKGRYRQQCAIAIYETSEATTASKNPCSRKRCARVPSRHGIRSPLRRGFGIVDVNVLYHPLFTSACASTRLRQSQTSLLSHPLPSAPAS